MQHRAANQQRAEQRQDLDAGGNDTRKAYKGAIYNVYVATKEEDIMLIIGGDRS